MKPTNLLFLFSDYHQRDILGCYGNDIVQTPHIDGLAHRGSRFANAYTNCPICVPSRASLATGRYVHQTRHWDNAFPYYGSPPGWGHRLQAQGYRVDSVGKLHYRRAEDDDGFTHKMDAIYVAEGLGELISCLRADAPARQGRQGLFKAGPGDSSYMRYDARIADQACEWLDDHAQDEKPWVFFVSFVSPHPPLRAPEDLFYHYERSDLPLPPQWHPAEWPQHPALDYMRTHFGWEPGAPEEAIHRVMATYYGRTTYLDQKIGQVLAALDDHHLTENTRVIYSSDHGAMLGARGLQGMFTMYDESCAVPLVMAGPDVPVGRTVQTPASLVDIFPTVVEAVGEELTQEEADLPGESLWSLADSPDRARTVFSEYHAAGSRHGSYMLCDGHTKYVHYLHEPAQLFNLDRDPQERHNLAGSLEHRSLEQDFESRLRLLVDVEAADRMAKADQRAKVEAFGGEEAVLARGLSNSAIPGEAPVFQHLSR